MVPGSTVKVITFRRDGRGRRRTEAAVTTPKFDWVNKWRADGPSPKGLAARDPTPGHHPTVPIRPSGRTTSIPSKSWVRCPCNPTPRSMMLPMTEVLALDAVQFK
ncbi:hypothetical protein ACFOGG_09645 [Brenneria rubrifaciens]|uniref:hypothetical protein n=1 Tax=Brenneria rubrifaciens TaxID=55213 RepID=UPI00360BB10A